MPFTINIMSNDGGELEKSPMRRQLVKTPPKDKNFRIILDAAKEDKFDMLFSYGKVFGGTMPIAKNRCVFVTPEPPNGLIYARRYLEQYGFLVTPFGDFYRTDNQIIISHAFLPWMYDWQAGELDHKRQLIKYKAPKNDKALISVVLNVNKKFTMNHIIRLDFVLQLKKILGTRLHLYGHGLHPLRSKTQAFDGYSYHLALENSSYDNHWTEKIADSYLADCFPFYYGCKNLDKFFTKESFIEIDIYDVDKSARLILAAIDNDIANKRKLALEQSRQKLHELYNMPQAIIGIAKQILQKEKISVVSQDNLDTNPPAANQTVFNRRFAKGKVFVRIILGGFIIPFIYSFVFAITPVASRRFFRRFAALVMIINLSGIR